MYLLLETNYDKSTVWRPFDARDLGLNLVFVLRLKLNMFTLSGLNRWDDILLHKHEVVLEVGEVLLAEMHELVHIVIRLSLEVFVQVETP